MAARLSGSCAVSLLSWRRRERQRQLQQARSGGGASSNEQQQEEEAPSSSVTLSVERVYDFGASTNVSLDALAATLHTRDTVGSFWHRWY